MAHGRLKCDFYLLLLNTFHTAACYRFSIELDMPPYIMTFFCLFVLVMFNYSLESILL